MGQSDYLAEHQWNVLCHVCGFKKKSSEIRKQWDGILACLECYTPRHEQDFIRGRRDRQKVPFSNPQSQTPTFVTGDIYVDDSFQEYTDDSGFQQYSDG